MLKRLTGGEFVVTESHEVLMIRCLIGRLFGDSGTALADKRHLSCCVGCTTELLLLALSWERFLLFTTSDEEAPAILFCSAKVKPGATRTWEKYIVFLVVGAGCCC